MDYQTRLQNALNTYQDLYTQYEELINSSKYFEIISTMPFEFLGATQLCDKLSLYERLEQKPRFFFSSKEEAYLFYQNLINFPKKSNELLEDAAYMSDIGKIANKMNHFVEDSPFLGDTYKVVPNTDVISIAEKCLQEIPLYRKKLTKSFRWNYIESVLLSLNMEELDWMLDKKVIRSEDIDHISLTETMNQYQDKIKHICEVLNREMPAEATYTVKLKGVTFSNEDGTSRQDILKQMEETIDSEQKITLKAIPYIYTPDVGLSEPAVRIEWNGQCIGYLGKDVVAEIDEKYNHPQYTAELIAITGGEDVSMGAKSN